MITEVSGVNPASILDSFNDVGSAIEAACSDVATITALSEAVVAELSTRESVTDDQIVALKRFFTMIPNEVAKTMWTSLLTNPATKKVVMPWQNDTEFCSALRRVYGLVAVHPLDASASS